MKRKIIINSNPLPRPGDLISKHMMGRKKHAKWIAKAIRQAGTHLNLAEKNVGDEEAKLIVDALPRNTNITRLNLHNNTIGDEGAKSIANALRSLNNHVIQMVFLGMNSIGDEGARTLADTLQHNYTVTTLDLGYNSRIGSEGAKCIANAVLRQNNTVTTLCLGGINIGQEATKLIACALEHNNTIEWLCLRNAKICDDGATFIASALRKNSSVKWLDLRNNSIGDEGAKAIADALLINHTMRFIYVEGEFSADLNRKIERLVKINRDSATPSIAAQQKGHEFVSPVHELEKKMVRNDPTLEVAEAVRQAGTHLNLKEKDIGDEEAKLIADALPQNTTITRLNLHNNTIGDEGAKSIADALQSINNRVIQMIFLGINRIGDYGARSLADALRHNYTVTALDLGYNRRIGNEGAKDIVNAVLLQNNTVTKLGLEGINIGDDVAKLIACSLEHNNTIEWLCLRNTNIWYDGATFIANALRKNSSVKRLDLRNNSIGVEGAKAIVDALLINHTMRFFYIDGTFSLDLNRKIERLVKINRDSATPSMAAQQKGHEFILLLRELEKRSVRNDPTLAVNNLKSERICDEAAEAVRQARTHLNLAEKNIGDEEAKLIANALPQNTTTIRLNQHKNTVGDEGAKFIANALESMNNRVIQMVFLGMNRIGDEGARSLADALQHNYTVTALDLGYNSRIGSEGAKNIVNAVLRQNSTVTTLGLGGINIGQEATKLIACSLEHNNTIEWLCLRNTNIGNNGATFIANALRKNTSVKWLDLRNNSIGNEGAKAIVDAFLLNHTMRFFYVHDKFSTELNGKIERLVKINRDSATPSMAAQQKGNEFILPLRELEKRIVRNDPTLAMINLKSKHIRDEEVKSITVALQQNNTVTELDLRDNTIGAWGATFIANALQLNNTITSLLLDRNKILDKGVKLIARALRQNTSLEWLCLRNNGIGDKGAQHIADTLRQNNTIKWLYLGNNYIGDWGTKFITNALRQNRTIEELDLWNNPISGEGAKSIGNALQRNRTSELTTDDSSLNPDADKSVVASLDAVVRFVNNSGCRNDAARPAFVQTEEDKIDERLEMLELERRKEKENEAMKTTNGGRALLFIRKVLESHEQLASLWEGNSKICPVAMDDMVFLAEKFLDCQDAFRSRGLPVAVTLAYHYTKGHCMERIRQDGLMTSVDRRRRYGPPVSFSTGVYGDGIYTATSPYAFHGMYGEVGLLVAVLIGNSQRVPGVRNSQHVELGEVNTVIGNKQHRVSTQYVPDAKTALFDEVVLLQSSQCLPLVRFCSTLISKTDDLGLGNESVWAYHCVMQRLVDEFFNNGKETTLTRIFPSLLLSQCLVYRAPSLLTSSISTCVNEFLKPCACNENCSICMEPLKRQKSRAVSLKVCNHEFHLECIESSLVHDSRCPVCRSLVKEAQGKCPSGTMSVTTASSPCAGFEQCGGSILITYSLPSGIQQSYHGSPGKQYDGTVRTAYLPNNYEGVALLKRLKYAWMKGLTFAIGTSLTTGRSDSIIWASIHHKTSLSGGPIVHGFPDDGFFLNCNKELDDLGVPSSQDCP